MSAKTSVAVLLLCVLLGCERSADVKFNVSGTINLDVTDEEGSASEPESKTSPQPTRGTFEVNGDLTDVRIRPEGSFWYERIDALPVHPRSREIILATEPVVASLGRRTQNDFGPDVGIPYAVGQGFPAIPITTTTYPAESDHGPFPIPLDAPIETGPDHHLIYFDRGEGNLIELGMAKRVGDRFSCEAAALFRSKLEDDQRPDGHTSADAAGLPILPGLVRVDEFKRALAQTKSTDRHLGHALRFTLKNTGHGYLYPARHLASTVPYALPDRPPMGMRIRVKSTLDLNQFNEPTQVLLRTLQLHGGILADNGANWFFSGTADPKWAEYWDAITSNAGGKKGLKSFAGALFENNLEVLDFKDADVITQTP
jgi:hypothetical protein